MASLSTLSVTAKRTMNTAHIYIQALNAGDVPAYYKERYSSFPQARMARGCAMYNELLAFGFTDKDIVTICNELGL